MATNISRALLLSATANTATPFLYQTRTLGPVLRSFQQPCTPHLRHPYSTRINDHNINDEAEVDESNEEPATKTPVAHQPRRSHLRKRGTSVLRRTESPEQVKSVTSRERAAFNKLLSQLNNDPNPTGGDEATHGTTGQNVKQNDIAELMKLFGGIVNINAQPKSNTEDLSESTHADRGAQKSDIVDVDNMRPEPEALDQPSEIEEMPMNEAIYTREELGLPPPRSGVDRHISMRQAVSLVVHQESCRIERALFEAIEGNKGDIAVWEVCKSHIFAMLHYMDGTNSANASATASSDNAIIIPPMIPAGRVITKLYPQALLMTFRLLNTHFPESQLISQFRASIKAQGRASALLGASPELYHEIVYFYWNGCRDLPAVISFLRDMDLHGVQPSRETIALLRSIEQQGQSHMKLKNQDPSESAQGGSPFWDLPPNQKALSELSADGGWLESFKRTRPSKLPRRDRSF